MPGHTWRVDNNFEILVKRLAKNLRRERVARGLSQEGLALEAEVDRTYV